MLGYSTPVGSKGHSDCWDRPYLKNVRSSISWVVQSSVDVSWKPGERWRNRFRESRCYLACSVINLPYVISCRSKNMRKFRATNILRKKNPTTVRQQCYIVELKTIIFYYIYFNIFGFFKIFWRCMVLHKQIISRNKLMVGPVIN